MKLEIKTKNFLKKLKVLESITKKKMVPAFCHCVRIDIKEDEACLRAADLEIWHSLDIADSIHSTNTAGTLVMPQKQLQSILRQVKTETCTLETLETSDTSASVRIEITSGGYVYTLIGVDPAGYPEFIEPPDLVSTVEMPYKTFLAAMSEISYIPVDDREDFTKAYIIDVQDNKMMVIRTDGYLLAVTNLKVQSTGQLNYLLPVSAVKQLERMGTSTACDDVLTVNFYKNRIKFCGKNSSIITRIFDYRVPGGIHQVIESKPASSSYRVNAEKLADLVNAASFIYKGTAGDVDMDFTGTRLTVSCEDALAQAKVRAGMDFENLDGLSKSVNIMGKSILAVCKAAKQTASKKTMDISFVGGQDLIFFEFGNSIHVLRTNL